MAVPPKVQPFRALRFDPARAATDLTDLICPPYDVIAPDEQADLAARSTFNAVHLELPIGLAERKYRQAAADLGAWRERGVLRVDDRLAYYLSETTFTHADQELTRRDLIVALDVEPWAN